MESRMNKFFHPAKIASGLVAMLALMSAGLAAAAPPEREPHRAEGHRGEPSRAESPRAEPARNDGRRAAPARAETHYASPHWRLDGRFNHDRYYPARGYIVPSLPLGRIEVGFGGGRYYYHGGVWFRPHGPRWIVVAPPIGILVPILPFGYSTIYYRSVPYYYADEVYYVRTPAGSYQVVAPPPVEEVTYVEAPPRPPASAPVPSAPVDGLFVYPRNGQTPTQTAFDRIDCVKWAIGQTGFDPSQGGDNTARANFQRAASACLDARGYSVK
jgi:hypothetical protein